jgi:hypothetical protein
MVQRIDAIYQNKFIKLKICVSTIFSVLEKDVKIDLQLSAFAQMFTYTPYIALTLPNVHGCNE